MDTALKRIIDVTTSTLGLVILSPLFVAVAVAIKRHDGGPIFYRATRVGKGGRHFALFKFRTMVVDADKQGPGITTRNDSRITPIGRRLRRTKLDELPQLINVLRGDMSLVGPRPEDPRYVAHYTPEQRRVLRVRPGITSAASLTYRNESQQLAGEEWETVYRTHIMPEKIDIDLEYLSHRTVWTDLKLIVRTIAALIR